MAKKKSRTQQSSTRVLIAENIREQRACCRKASRLFAHATRLIACLQKSGSRRQKATLKRRIAHLLYDTDYELQIASNLEWMRQVLAGH